jgi:DNA-binding protein H-NS
MTIIVFCECMTMRTMQTLVNHWRLRPMRWGQSMRGARHGLPRAVALAIAPLMLGSCAELVELRTDIARLRSDLHANTETLSQLTARLDELERRQATTDSAARQTHQELSQAIEVLLKKALIAENRLARIGSERHQSKGLEKLDSQARQPPSEPQDTSPQGKNPRPGGKHLSLGMTQEDVRRTLGDPISIEDAGSYIFWQYSWLSNQKYVVFDKDSGQVSGWRGL